MKRPTTINLDSATRDRLERAREQCRVNGLSKPSLSAVTNAAIEAGLPRLLGEEKPSQPPPSGRAA